MEVIGHSFGSAYNFNYIFLSFIKKNLKIAFADFKL